MVGHDALDTVDLKSLAGAGQMLGALVQRPAHDGFKGVELQLSRLRCHCDHQVVADHFEGDLVHHLWDDRIDLAGHDRGAGLTGRQQDVASKPACGPDESSRRSLEIFDYLHATRLSTPESCTNAP